MKDAIIVLGNAVNPDGTLPEIPKQRVEKGVELYKAGVSSRIIMSGKHGFLVTYTHSCTEAEAMVKYAAELGVPPDHLFKEEESLDTIGNAFFTKKKYLKPNNWRDVVVVTSDFHMERTKYIFDYILGNDYNIEYIACVTKADAKWFEDVAARDQLVLDLSKRLMQPARQGDDEAIERMLYNAHPAYAKNPTISKEELLKMLGFKVNEGGLRKQ